MIRKLIVSVILGSLVVGGGVGAAFYFITHRREPMRREPRPMLPRVTAPAVEAREDYTVEIVGYGSARPKVRLEISPQVGGEIDYRSESFLSGRMVQGPRDEKPGEVLFRIDSERYQLAVRNAEEQIKVLKTRLTRLDREEKNLTAMRNIASEQITLDKKELERYQQLFKQNASTETEIEQAMGQLLATRRSLQEIENQLALIPENRAELQAQIAAAQVALMQAKLDLKYATYTAPVTGRIISSDINKGDYVQPGEVCGEMYGTDIMELPISIMAGDLRWIDRQEVDNGGIPATVSQTESGTGTVYTWQGRVKRIEAGVEAQTRMARLIVIVENAAQPAGEKAPPMLDINMYCRVTIGGLTIPKAFILPRGAIIGGDSVYVAAPHPDDPGKGYTLQRRSVRVARYTDGEAMILPGQGLQEGDRVIVSTVPKPVEGMTIVLDAAGQASPEESTTKSVEK